MYCNLVILWVISFSEFYVDLKMAPSTFRWDLTLFTIIIKNVLLYELYKPKNLYIP